jgi:hypothetical protein
MRWADAILCSCIISVTSGCLNHDTDNGDKLCDPVPDPLKGSGLLVAKQDPKHHIDHEQFFSALDWANSEHVLTLESYGDSYHENCNAAEKQLRKHTSSASRSKLDLWRIRNQIRK